MNNNDIYVFFDKPILYKENKDEGLKLYVNPVRMDKYFEFFTVSSILLIDKNSIPDVAVISMGYLEYLYKHSNEENYYIDFIHALLTLVLSVENDDGDEEELYLKFFFDGLKKSKFSVNGVMYDSKDFDEIRDIICSQNLLTLPNDKIEKSLRDAMAEEKRLRQIVSGAKASSIEDQMIGLSVATGIPFNDIYRMTIRKFIKSLERIDHKIHYEMLMAGQLSGMVKYKQKPKHWLANLEKDELDGMIPYSEMEQKLSPASGN